MEEQNIVDAEPRWANGLSYMQYCLLPYCLAARDLGMVYEGPGRHTWPKILGSSSNGGILKIYHLRMLLALFVRVKIGLLDVT